MRAGRLIACLLATHLTIGVPLPRAAEREREGSIAVVVGKSSPVRGVTIDSLRELYLRRRRVWPDGNAVIPINLPPDSDLRKAFSKHVLGLLPEQLVTYWNRRYFEGIRPPLVLRTPEAVCAYVAVEPDAIGYVPVQKVDREACRVVLVLPESAD